MSAADGPLVGLLGEDGADEAGDGGLVGEEADDVGLAPRGGDADAEAPEVTIPVDGILAAGVERIDGALGDGSVL